MKKMMMLALAALMCLCMLAACGSEPAATEPTKPTETVTEPAAPETQAPTEAETEAATEPATEPATEAETEAATEPATEPAETEFDETELAPELNDDNLTDLG